MLVIKASSDSAMLPLIVLHLWAPSTHWPQAREGVLLGAFCFHFFSSVCKAEPSGHSGPFLGPLSGEGLNMAWNIALLAS